MGSSSKKITMRFVFLLLLFHCQILELPKPSSLPEMLVIINCSDSSRDCNSSGQAIPPSVFYYPNSNQTLIQNSQVNIGSPTLDGSGPCRFTSDSQLPEGLALDSTTGAISGVPTKLIPLSIHIIKATCLAGEMSTSLTLKVISYACSVTTAPMELTSFGFNSASTGLNQSYAGTFSGQNISVQLPYGITSTAPATFTTTGTGVTVNGIPQTSGTTQNDFTNTVMYSVKNSDDCTKDYLVSVFATTPISDSGQTLCYDNTTSVACTGTIGSFPGQDGDYVNVPNARALSASPITNAGYPSDYIVKDSLTGIVWKACPEGKSGATCATGSITNMNWYSAESACNALNSANSGSGFAGLKTWRLPGYLELQSIANYSNASPAIDVTMFPATPATVNFWARETYAAIPANSWYFGYQFGTDWNGTGGFDRTTGSIAVRCVAGNTPPGQSFTDNGDSTVTDNRTKLVWHKCNAGKSGATCSSGTYSSLDWASALSYCNNSSISGKVWRLPNIRELKTIVDSNTSNPSVNTAYFPNSSGTNITSTSFPSNNPNIFHVTFTNGWTNSFAKTTTTYFRCVSGP